MYFSIMFFHLQTFIFNTEGAPASHSPEDLQKIGKEIQANN